ncbi:DUF2334 domain-containing protein [uncultured Clostridium sp.]|uniref:DUF2334 domain-containing protein n=1 Tax=uncultured Clostridium sp. TaxID=59620 RepID=UPI0025F3BBFC|nr:DUF2334 domain-containing protein [uncultured Clostridium sp.]
MKITKKKFLIPLSCMIIPLLCYCIAFYFSFFQNKVFVKDNKVISSQIPDNNFNSLYTPKYNFSEIPYREVNNIRVNVLGNILSDISILEKSQRYYIPLNSISKALNFIVSENVSQNSYTLINSTTTYILTDTSCNINNHNYSLRGNLIVHDEQPYISLSDIEYIFNLTVTFDYDENTIFLLKPLYDKKEFTEELEDGTVALIRLEDFSADNTMLNSDIQIKFKIIGNFLRSNNIRFHIAWVPRYKCPTDNIDNDLLTEHNIRNVGFINLMDYLINCGAEIGLHGYTHQYKDSTSLSGTELSKSINNTEEATRAIVENAIDTATALNIPYTFFESSHYKATKKEKEIISEYVKYLYEPMNYFIYTKLQKSNSNLYIPTPLGYVKDLDISYIKNELCNPRPGELASFFYHTIKELNFINFNISNNIIENNYSNDSPLQQIISTLKNNGYTTIHVSDFK